MFKFSTYLNNDDENYINPVTGETKEQERARIKAHRSYVIRNHAGDYIGAYGQILVALIPFALLLFLILT